MQEQTAMPKSYRDQLDALNVGDSIDLISDEERNKFNAVRYRDFHGNPDSEKIFVIKKDPKTKQTKIWRAQ